MRDFFFLFRLIGFENISFLLSGQHFLLFFLAACCISSFLSVLCFTWVGGCIRVRLGFGLCL